MCKTNPKLPVNTCYHPHHKHCANPQPHNSHPRHPHPANPHPAIPAPSFTSLTQLRRYYLVWRRETGSGTVLSLGLFLALICCAVLIGGLFSATRAQGQAQTAADLAALQAARVHNLNLVQTELHAAAVVQTPCALAANVAAANAARLSSCHVSGRAVQVSTSRPVVIFGLTMQATATARAAPAP